MKDSIIFIINPISGVGKKDKIPHIIEQNIDTSLFDYRIVYTEYRGHALQIAEDAARSSTTIVAIVGGDGSVNEVGSALVDTSTALAIIPTGSGNGVARHLGVPLNIKKAIQAINKNHIEPMDIVELNNKIAIGVSGFGFDALIAKRFDEFHARGLWSYVRLIFKEFRKYKGIDVTVNGKEYTQLFFCSIANTTQFGNGFHISPESKVNDSKIELILIKKPNFLGIVNLAIGSYFGTIHQSKHVEILSLPYFQLQTSNPSAHIDGETIQFDTLSIDVKVIPKSLLVVKSESV